MSPPPTPRASYLSSLGDTQESAFLTIARWCWCCPSKDHWLNPPTPPPQWWGNWGLVPGTPPPVLLMAEPVDCTKCQLQVARVRFNVKWSLFLKHFSNVLTVMILCFIKNNHFMYSNSNWCFGFYFFRTAITKYILGRGREVCHGKKFSLSASSGQKVANRFQGKLFPHYTQLTHKIFSTLWCSSFGKLQLQVLDQWLKYHVSMATHSPRCCSS